MNSVVPSLLRSIMPVLILFCLAGRFTAVSAAGADLIVSANDAKYQRVEGADTYPEGVGADTLTVLDAAAGGLRVVASVPVSHTLAGPPQGVAITPDGRLAIVSSPNYYDRASKAVVLGSFLQVVDLTTTPARLVDRIELGSHPQGLAINRGGTLLLAATLAVVGAIVGEWLGGSAGLGILVNLARGSLFDTPLLFAALVQIALLGAFAYTLVVAAERLSTRIQR